MKNLLKLHENPVIFPFIIHKILMGLVSQCQAIGLGLSPALVELDVVVICKTWQLFIKPFTSHQI